MNTCINVGGTRLGEFALLYILTSVLLPRGGGYLTYEHTGRCRWKIWKATLSRSQIPENDTLSRSKFSTLSLSFFRQICALQRKFVRNLSKNVEILPFKRFKSHLQSENGLKRPFGVKNDRYGPCHGADFYKNDTLSRSRNPENDTLFSGTSPYRKIYEYPPPPGTAANDRSKKLGSTSSKPWLNVHLLDSW